MSPRSHPDCVAPPRLGVEALVRGLAGDPERLTDLPPRRPALASDVDRVLQIHPGLVERSLPVAHLVERHSKLSWRIGGVGSGGLTDSGRRGRAVDGRARRSTLGSGDLDRFGDLDAIDPRAEVAAGGCQGAGRVLGIGGDATSIL